MWIHWTLVGISSGLFSCVSLFLSWKPMPYRSASSSNILLLVKISYCSHTILVPWTICSFNHFSALGFFCNLYFSYSHFPSRLFSLSCWKPGLSMREQVSFIFVSYACTWFLSQSWRLPSVRKASELRQKTWANLSSAPGYSPQSDNSCRGKIPNCPKYEAQSKVEAQPGACRQKRLNFIRLVSGVAKRIFLRKVWKRSYLKTWQLKRILKIARWGTE